MNTLPGPQVKKEHYLRQGLSPLRITNLTQQLREIARYQPKSILEIGPNKIVYVSCNPATQARDLALLDISYKVEKVQPVDMFPHTHHVENVVLLLKK